MASCLSGGGRAYGLKIDVIKSPSSTSWISNSPSPSSSLSESSNSQIAISTRKPRTPRKRPNETYNEAAALLSKIYPKLFPMKHLTKPYKFTKQMYPFTYESSELLLPFQSTENSSFLIHPSLLENPQFPALERSSCEKTCLSPGEITSTGISMEVCGEFDEDFDAESILDEEIEQGIQSILGNSSVENEPSSEVVGSTCYGYPVGLGYRIDFENGFGSRNYIKAFRNYDDGEWLGYNSVNIEDITPKFHETPTATVEVAVEAVATGDKKKKKKKVEKMKKVIINKFQEQKEAAAQVEEPPNPKRKIGLLLKLDYDNVLKAWSDQESPFSDDSPAVGNDVHGRISAINMLTESGGIREARVLRYKEKRRTRLFSKKIRYQVRKLNADQRPRMQGRFVRRSNSPESGQG